MFFIDTIAVESLGNHSYLAGGGTAAVAVDPPRDIDRVIAAAARRGVGISHVLETHVHNDYVSGGLELARITGARYLVPARARVGYPRVPVADGDVLALDDGLTVRALATPGHTPHHTSYVLAEDGRPVAAFTGGSLLIGSVGRPDLIEPRLTATLARAQHAAAHRLAAELADEVAVLPTHGFGSFCSAAPAAGGTATTIGRERISNPALVQDVDSFVAALLAGLDDVPGYYARVGPINAVGPPPVDLTPPRPAGAAELAARLAAGEWLVDLRGRLAFAAGHLAGSVNFEGDGKLATYLAWLIPPGRPVTLLAETHRQIATAQRELARVGIDRPAAAGTGDPAGWLPPGGALRRYRVVTFAELAAARGRGESPVVLDVRRHAERSAGSVLDSTHIPVHELRGRTGELPAGPVWVHCASGMRAAIAASLLDTLDREVLLIDDEFAVADQEMLVRKSVSAR